MKRPLWSFNTCIKVYFDGRELDRVQDQYNSCVVNGVTEETDGGVKIRLGDPLIRLFCQKDFQCFIYRNLLYTPHTLFCPNVHFDKLNILY